MRRLKDIEVLELSLVEKAATKKKFLVVKQDDDDDSEIKWPSISARPEDLESDDEEDNAEE